MVFKAVLFDCDGVLVGSEKIASDTEVKMLTDLGCDADHHMMRDACFGKTQPEIFQYFRDRWGSKIPLTFEQDYKAVLERNFNENLKAMPGVENFVAFLDLPKAVVTNSSAEHLTYMLSKTGLIDYFMGKMFSYDMVNQGKPAPDLYLLAAETLGVTPIDCLVIEDSAIGVRAAKAAGMTVIGFIGGDHSFSGHKELLENAGADKIIFEFTEILDFINQRAA